MKIKADPKELEVKKPKHDKGALFQCWIDRDLLREVVKKRDLDGVSWKALIEACFELYLKS